MERTFAMIKPEGVNRGLIGEIIMRIERKGYHIVALQMLSLTPEMASEHYAEHVGKPFFTRIVEHISSNPVVAMILEGPDVVSEFRKMMGATNPINALTGTIRGDFANDMSLNIIHGSDSVESATREIKIFFK